MLELGEYLASGLERDVYRHPVYPDRIIKLRREIARADRNALDYAFYRVVGPERFRQIPRLYGWVDTVQGRGLEVEFIADADGNPCKPLPDSVLAGLLSEAEATKVLEAFFEEAIDSGLLMYDTSLDNLLYQPQTSSMFLVDGQGARKWSFWNSMRARFPALARNKTIRGRNHTMLLWKDWLLRQQHKRTLETTLRVPDRAPGIPRLQAKA